jgi:hypothetical protein
MMGWWRIVLAVLLALTFAFWIVAIVGTAATQVSGNGSDTERERARAIALEARMRVAGGRAPSHTSSHDGNAPIFRERKRNTLTNRPPAETKPKYDMNNNPTTTNQQTNKKQTKNKTGRLQRHDPRGAAVGRRRALPP